MIDIESLRAKWLEYKNNGQPYQNPWGEYVVSTYELGSLLDAIEALMAERKLDMADWVAAACRSKLGQPWWGHEMTARWHNVGENGLQVILYPEGFAEVGDCNGEFIHRVNSPSELRAELDGVANDGI